MEKNYIAAIDLGSSNVVAALGNRSGGRVHIEDVVVVPAEGVEGGEVKNVESASRAIRKAVDELEKRQQVRICEVYAGISGSHLRCAKHPYYVLVGGKDGEITAADVRSLNDSMRNMQAPEGYRLLHIVPQHYMVDDEEEVQQPVGRFGKTLGSSFNLVIGKTMIIQRLEKALQKAGVGLSRLFINPLAMAEAVTFPDEKTVGVAVVDLGAGTTDVCIFSGGIVRNMSVIPLGASSVNKDIQSFGIMERYVEQLKVDYGCAVADMVDETKRLNVPGHNPKDTKEISFRNLATIIESRLTDIVEYVMAEIEEAGYEDKLGAGIVLTGGGALLSEIKTLFENKTGMTVRIASPTVVVTEESSEKVADIRTSAAVGMLYHGMLSGVPTRVEGVRTSEPEPVYTAPEPEDNIDDTPLGWDNTRHGGGGKKEQKPKGGGWFSNLGKKIKNAVDMDALDDDTMI